MASLAAGHWPPPQLVSWMAAEATKLRKMQVAKPLPFVDLAKYAKPAWATGQGDGARAWAAAFVTYAIAAQVTGQWQLGSSLGRLQNCLR
eukprot:5112449-Lingulodinium_polyedra.AAC.1